MLRDVGPNLAGLVKQFLPGQFRPRPQAAAVPLHQHVQAMRESHPNFRDLFLGDGQQYRSGDFLLSSFRLFGRLELRRLFGLRHQHADCTSPARRALLLFQA
jgi:hypothetical protein